MADPAVSYTADYQLGKPLGGISLGISAPKMFRAHEPMVVEVGTFNVSSGAVMLTYPWFSTRWKVIVRDADGRVIPENGAVARGGGWIQPGVPQYESVPPQFGLVDTLNLSAIYQLPPGRYSAMFVKDGDAIAIRNKEDDPLKQRIAGKTLSSASVFFEVR